MNSWYKEYKGFATIPNHIDGSWIHCFESTNQVKILDL